MDRPRLEIVNHIADKDNLCLNINRQTKASDWQHILISRFPTPAIYVEIKDGSNVFPLYLYPETGDQQNLLETTARTPNLNEEIVEEIAARLGLRFVSEKEETTPSTTTPSTEAVDTPPLEGGELEELNLEELNLEELNLEELNLEELDLEGELETPKSSPPSKGGVSEGRGGFLTSSTYESKEKINNLPYLKTFRKTLRNNLTPAEAKFWKVVQNKNLAGRKFRRQHSVGNYILDFYCPSEKLAIELDGEVHFGDAARVYDYERRLFLEHYGIKVLRFENKLVFEELAWVLDVIKSNFGWGEREMKIEGEKQPPRQRSVATPPSKGGEPEFGNSINLEPEISTNLESENSTNLEPENSVNLEPENSPPSKGGVATASVDGVVDLQTFAPIDVLDYIYAVLHSPTYREKYKEFLKIDFPRVPYPKDAETFWNLVKFGGELRQIHLLESPKVEQFITTYPKGGDNIVTRKMTNASIGFEQTTPDAIASSPPLEGGEQNITGKVWINDEQFFDKVPLAAWEFYIGGYQPAQKWLKDRNGRELSYDDIRHYQKIIAALTETDGLMKEIDKIELE